MCCEKTGICRGSNRSLCADFAFRQLLDNPRNSPENALAVASFFAQIAIIRKLNRANTVFGCFYKQTEAKRTLNQDFLDRFFLLVCMHFDRHMQPPGVC